MTMKSEVRYTAVGRWLMVWCAVEAAVSAAEGGGKAGRYETCVPCGTARRCVPLTSLCDGSWDCPAGEDEDRQFCDDHLFRRSRGNDAEGNNGRINSRTPRPPSVDQLSDFQPERTSRQVNASPNLMDTPRPPIVVRTVAALNSSNTSNLIFIHLPDEQGNHPTLLQSLTRDAPLAANATFINRLNVKTKNSKSRSKYKHSQAVNECCGHCVRCASSETCVAHSQLCDGLADCMLMEDEAPAFCQVFSRGGCPSGLAPCNGLCVPWSIACTEHCVQRPHFEACFAVRRKQLDIAFLNKSSATAPHIRLPFAPLANSSHAVLRPALPASPLPLTVSPLHLTRPATSLFPSFIADETTKTPLPQLHDKFIKVPELTPNSQVENIASSNNSTYSSIIYKCSPTSLEDRIFSQLSGNTLLLNSPTKSSFLNINSEDLLQGPADVSNTSAFDRLKAALANIHRNLMNFDKTLIESRSSKLSSSGSSNYPVITYHCVLASKDSDKKLSGEDFLKDGGKAQSTDKDNTEVISLDRKNFTNGTSTSNSRLENNQSTLFERESSSQVSPVEEATPEILQSSTYFPSTTHTPPLSGLMEMLVSPPPSQMMPPCPPVFTPVAHTCLAALPFSMTWQDAGEVCEKLGGQLAEARDISVLTAVARFLRHGGLRADFWIGGFYDVVNRAWMWRSGAKMKMSTPFWGYRHTEECSELVGRSYSPARYPACSHHQQAPLNSTKGFCAALDAKFFYFITDHPCMHARKVLCSHDRRW